LAADGDKRWLQGLEFVPKKLRYLNEINKILAHRPWQITATHIERLTRGTDENWSLSEVVHAIVLLTHFHALASLVWSSGITEDESPREGHHNHHENDVTSQMKMTGSGTSGETNSLSNSTTATVASAVTSGLSIKSVTATVAAGGIVSTTTDSSKATSLPLSCAGRKLSSLMNPIAVGSDDDDVAMQSSHGCSNATVAASPSKGASSINIIVGATAAAVVVGPRTGQDSPPLDPHPGSPPSEASVEVSFP
jgi:hypothetical protein